MGFLSAADIAEIWGVSERIHPFQDGNGRVGRLIMFKERLSNSLVPFIIADDMKAFYYRGLSEWDCEKGFLTDTCLTAQDRFKAELSYFRIPFDHGVGFGCVVCQAKEPYFITENVEAIPVWAI